MGQAYEGPLKQECDQPVGRGKASDGKWQCRVRCVSQGRYICRPSLWQRAGLEGQCSASAVGINLVACTVCQSIARCDTQGAWAHPSSLLSLQRLVPDVVMCRCWARTSMGQDAHAADKVPRPTANCSKQQVWLRGVVARWNCKLLFFPMWVRCGGASGLASGRSIAQEITGASVMLEHIETH